MLSPVLLHNADYVWDTCWVMLGGAALLVLFVVVQPRRPLGLFGAGLACGAVALINPVLTSCYPVWVVYSWWRNRRDTKKTLHFARCAALVLAGFVLAILPWTIRNYRTFGKVMYMRGNLPLEMWVGNAPWSDGYALSGSMHPVVNTTEAARMVALGEFGYYQACKADLVRWWRADPTRFVTRGLKRLRWFFLGRYDLPMSPEMTLVKAASYGAPGVLALVGALALLLKRRRARVMAVTLAVFPLIYTLCTVYVRYRLPVEPLLMLVAVVGAVEVYRFFVWTGEQAAAHLSLAHHHGRRATLGLVHRSGTST